MALHHVSWRFRIVGPPPCLVPTLPILPSPDTLHGANTRKASAGAVPTTGGAVGISLLGTPYPGGRLPRQEAGAGSQEAHVHTTRGLAGGEDIILALALLRKRPHTGSKYVYPKTLSRF